MVDVSFLWDAIYGNRPLKEFLINEIYANRLCHAYLLEGPENSGKLTLARTVAACFAETKADVKKITTGVCPDVIEISLPEKKKSIGVDTVREIRAAVYLKSNDLDCKFILLSDADTMTQQAQNALLKLIEDPPRNVYFFLLCTNASSLLATIRSRAPLLRMQIFTPEELAEHLLEHSVDARVMKERSPDVFDSVVRSSHGAYGEALARIVKTEMQMNEAIYIVTDIMDALAAHNQLLLFQSVMKLPADRMELQDSISDFRRLIRDVTACRLTDGNCEYMFPVVKKIREYTQVFSMERLLRIDEILSQISASFFTNPNQSTLKITLYNELARL